MKFTNNNQIFMSVFLTLYALLVFRSLSCKRMYRGLFYESNCTPLHSQEDFSIKKDKQWNK